MPNERKLTREQAADFGNAADVILGSREYTVVPQRIGYLRSKLGVVLAGVLDQDLTGNNIMDFLGDKLYGTLKVFIPDLMPEWEFHGYATMEAMAEDVYDEQYDDSPSPTQIKRAFQAVSEVNEIDLLRHLGKLIGPDLIRSWVAGAVADSMQASLPRSPRTSGESPGTSSPMSAPTEE